MSAADSVPSFAPYDSAAAEALLTELRTLTTFEQVVDWDRRAALVVEHIQAYLADLDSIERNVNAIERQALDEHNQRFFLRRLAGPSPAVASARKWKTQAAAGQEAATVFSDRLQAGIDQTPNSRDDQAEMVRALKLTKKELALQKREAGEALRQIRVEARQKSSEIDTGLGSVLMGASGRRDQRISLRLEKEAAAKPHESVKALIERQILAIDRIIQWVERFK
jgi:Mg2+ and Co2+ transporter CorA